MNSKAKVSDIKPSNVEYERKKDAFTFYVSQIEQKQENVLLQNNHITQKLTCVDGKCDDVFYGINGHQCVIDKLFYVYIFLLQVSLVVGKGNTLLLYKDNIVYFSKKKKDNIVYKNVRKIGYAVNYVLFSVIEPNFPTFKILPPFQYR